MSQHVAILLCSICTLALNHNRSKSPLSGLVAGQCCLSPFVDCPPLQQEGASRDVLLLDIALERYFRVLIERQEKSSLSGDSLVDLVTLVLQNTVIAAESLELGQVLALLCHDPAMSLHHCAALTPHTGLVVLSCVHVGYALGIHLVVAAAETHK